MSEGKKTTALITEAMNAGSLTEVETILDRNPQIDEQFPGGILGWVKNVDAAKLLISRGCNVNAVHPRYGTPLARAILRGDVELVRTLLAAHARVDIDEKLICGAVQKNLEIVKLLVEAGADIHEEYYASALECQMNALSLAIAHGKKDIAEYLRSLGAVMPGEKPGSDVGVAKSGNAIAPVSAKDDEPTPVLRELVPTHPPIEIHVQPPTSDTPWIRLVTFGLSEHRLPVPEGEEGFAYAELMIDLPPDWKYQAIDDPIYGWPVRWLRIMAKHPVQHNTWFGEATVYSGVDPDSPIAPNTRMTCMLLVAMEEMEFKGKTIKLYRVLPLYSEERELERRKGAAALLLALAEQAGQDAMMIVDVHRKNAAAK